MNIYNNQDEKQISADYGKYLTPTAQMAQGTFIHTISAQFQGKGYVIYLTLHSGAYKYQTWPLAHAETEI